jgi:5-carboxyvanillate decarboxylase
MRKIAVEEAFATGPLLDAWRGLLEEDRHGDPCFASLYGALLRGPATAQILAQLTDLSAQRIAAMDQASIDVQVLSVTAPGVQVFAAEEACAWARSLNDLLADTVAQHPTRFAGLAALAPQDPKAAARELERAVTALHLRGAIINSHTQGDYLDDVKFRPIFEAAQALDVPLYLHPSTPSPQMAKPYLSHGLEGAMWGFAAETSLHALRLIMSGLFDHYPRLRILLGHLGEGLPFWLPRIDSRALLMSRMSGREGHTGLRRRPSEYFVDNFLVTTSGMNWHPQVLFALATVGVERVLFAADYPYESMQEAVALMNTLPIAPEQLARVYHRNAERTFKLKRGEQ